MSKRLTTRLANGGVMYDNGEYYAVCYPWNDHCLRSIDRMAIKLCELEDRIEQGQLVEVRHGEWRTVDSDLGYVEMECSLCGHKHLFHTNQGYPYCPGCGAKMSGERKDDEIH